MHWITDIIQTAREGDGIGVQVPVKSMNSNITSVNHLSVPNGKWYLRAGDTKDQRPMTIEILYVEYYIICENITNTRQLS